MLDEIRSQYTKAIPAAGKVSADVGLRIHAGRRAEEMDELKRTFYAQGLDSYMAPATQQVLQAIAALNTGQVSASGARQGDLAETIELFYEKGLLQFKSPGKNS